MAALNVSMRPRRRSLRVVLLCLTLGIVFWKFFLLALTPDRPVKEEHGQYPLVKELFASQNGTATGGVWYIPPDWTYSSTTPVRNILEAANLAFQATESIPERHLPHSSIPLILHQKGRYRDPEQWSKVELLGVEKWLQHAYAENMAFFWWDDSGVRQLVRESEPALLEWYEALPSDVERCDIFRYVVTNSVGGIYTDLDTYPLRSPRSWIRNTDIEPWTDRATNTLYSSLSSVKLILGIEADCPETSNACWRMGYDYSVQLASWTVAASPHHGVLSRFVQHLIRNLREIANETQLDVHSEEYTRELSRVDPVTLTGPVAITEAAKSWLEDTAGLRWHALSGLHDHGKTKLVDDVLILPITGFSPGRRWYGNMGSRPLSDPDARVWHCAEGSWRKFDVKVELGKLCRSMFGLCRSWPTSYA